VLAEPLVSSRDRLYSLKFMYNRAVDMKGLINRAGRMSMAMTERRYSKKEFARRGDVLLESKVRPNLTAADNDKFVAIDIETGEYELDKSEMKAADRLRKRVPDPQIWLVHVTLGYLHRFGGHGRRGQP
jgi:hypothetical protein